MNYLNYFAKNGFIYGVSKKFEFGHWSGYSKKFTSIEEAEKWLDGEEYDFRSRELCSKTKASQFA